MALQLPTVRRSRDRVDITVFNEPVRFLRDRRRALKDFEIICAMRERTPFPPPLFAALPKLKLLITSGMRNAAIGSWRRRKSIGCAVRHANGHVIPTADCWTKGLILE